MKEKERSVMTAKKIDFFTGELPRFLILGVLLSLII